MKYLLLVCSLLTGCSSQSINDSIKDQLFEKVTGKEYSNNASKCASIKTSCPAGKYQEWQRENGQTACACD